MSLVDFLVHLLQAQAETLKSLAALFGEEIFIQMLESVAESEDSAEQEESNSRSFPDSEGLRKFFSRPKIDLGGDPYRKLEGAVQEMGLSPVLEFYLWSYPPYREIIETTVELDWVIQVSPKSDSMSFFISNLVNETVRQAKLWVEELPLTAEFSLRAEKMALVPWLRFRSEVLKKLGQRPISAL